MVLLFLICFPIKHTRTLTHASTRECAAILFSRTTVHPCDVLALKPKPPPRTRRHTRFACSSSYLADCLRLKASRFISAVLLAMASVPANQPKARAGECTSVIVSLCTDFRSWLHTRCVDVIVKPRHSHDMPRCLLHRGTSNSNNQVTRAFRPAHSISSHAHSHDGGIHSEG